MPSSKIYDFTLIVENLISAMEKNGVTMSNAEKESIKKEVGNSMKEMFQDGLPKVLAQSPELIKKVSLMVTCALVNERDPKNKLDLKSVFKDPATINEVELKAVFTLLFQKINSLRPIPRPVGEDGLNDQINKQVDACMEAADPKEVLDVLVEEIVILKMMVTKHAIEEQELDAEANLNAGATHRPGEVRESAIQVLLGNAMAIAASAQYSAKGTLASSVSGDSNSSPAVQMQAELRKEAQGVVSIVSESVTQAMSAATSPKPAPPQ